SPAPIPATRDRRLAASTRRVPEIRAPASPPASGPHSLVLDPASLVEVARSADLRAARYRDRVAAEAISGSLGRAQSACKARPTVRATRTHHPDPQDLVGQCPLGLAAHPGRIAETGHRSREVNGGEIPGAPPQTALPHVAYVPQQPRERAHLHRFLHRTHR